MANNFKGIVKLTEDQYKQLVANDTLTVGDTKIDYSDDILYVTDEPKMVPSIEVTYENRSLSWRVVMVPETTTK